ncbi:MAG TPA: DUF4012 domain-containing protein [Candidatus Saccharimonadia bacterium]|nr:DUF4012 domain-containing protein [Candidatus Saccharimonadia bacterium]
MADNTLFHAFDTDESNAAAGATPVANEMPVTDSTEAIVPTAVSKSDDGGKVAKRILKSVLIVLIPLLILVGAAGAYGYTKYQQLSKSTQELQAAAVAAEEALKSQNLPETDKKLTEVEAKFTVVRDQYNSMAWMKAVPFVNAYYNDGVHGLNAGEAGIAAGRTAVKAIEPYADVLGFTGAGSFTGGSVDNRVKLLLETLSKIQPVMDQLTSQLDTVDSELAQINENRYPVSFRGHEIRSKITTVKDLAAGAKNAVVEGRPVLEVLPDVAGATGKRKKYLVIFQNDNEIRPTGGFMTAYATLYIENGTVSLEKSDDIYQLDTKFANKPAAPPILLKYLTTEKRWNIRDMNTSPDVKNSMDVFWSYYSKLPGEPRDVDGIVMVDTHVLSDLVKLLGPVEVPGFGTFSAETDKRCDCPQIIYALSEIVDRPTPFLRADRKGIIGPMMQGVLAKAYGAPHQLWPDLFKMAGSEVQGKHVQFYFFDPKIQAAAESIDAAGRVQNTPNNSDYFMLVDANLGGAKSNLFITSDVLHEVSAPTGGNLEETVTVTYKNPHPGSNCNLEAGQLCLNGKLFDWVRIYLPKGAQIGDTLGFDQDSVKTYDELDHTVVEGVFTLEPLNQAKIKVSYKVPYTDTKNYNLYIEKQGGAKDTSTVLSVNGAEHALTIDKDQAVTLPF